MSTVDKTMGEQLRPAFSSSHGSKDSPAVKAIIKALNLQQHPEGGYFAETDRDTLRVPNPFLPKGHSGSDDATRAASTTIYYLLTPESPMGGFHRNKARTVHTLHKGRGRYVLIHADQASQDGRAPVETFVVGQDLEKGERLQWIVDGGKYKASFLLPDPGSETSSEGLLISETVCPGFEFADHDFLERPAFEKLLLPEQQKELSWLVRGA